MHAAYSRHPEWRDVPMFVPDAPYFSDEMSLDYFTSEVRRSVDFITEHTGKVLDMERLREVVEESNKSFALWQEYSDVRRATPAPHGSALPSGCVNMALSSGAGTPDHTAWFASVVADAERRVRENDPEVPNQKIRVLWFDFPPSYHVELFGWMLDEWGAIVVMDMASNCPYELVDTSSDESIFRGLAARALQHPVMIRHSHSTADRLIGEMSRLVRDYRVDCVIYPAHMGHKDQSACISLMRGTCRELKVPYLHVGLDNFDPTYTSVNEIKDKISEFFRGLGLG
jgi:benzoyl-CoA reductase/2-hydroxyglutaryl-CoA dehydratase subunit BcrC/BadD/HgdB